MYCKGNGQPYRHPVTQVNMDHTFDIDIIPSMIFQNKLKYCTYTGDKIQLGRVYNHDIFRQKNLQVNTYACRSDINFLRIQEQYM